jgi:CheY-like chemotaxis protein
MKPARIVLVEDNPADVYLFELALRENGICYELIHFETGAEAVHGLCDLETMQTERPDIILLDLNTPRSDGFQVLLRFRNNPDFATVPMAIITSSRASSDKFRSHLQGVRLIEKPSQLEDFLEAVGKAVQEMLVEAGRIPVATPHVP